MRLLFLSGTDVVTEYEQAKAADHMDINQGVSGHEQICRKLKLLSLQQPTRKLHDLEFWPFPGPPSTANGFFLLRSRLGATVV